MSILIVISRFIQRPKIAVLWEPACSQGLGPNKIFREVRLDSVMLELSASFSSIISECVAEAYVHMSSLYSGTW